MSVLYRSGQKPAVCDKDIDKWNIEGENKYKQGKITFIIIFRHFTANKTGFHFNYRYRLGKYGIIYITQNNN